MESAVFGDSCVMFELLDGLGLDICFELKRIDY